MRRSCEEDIWCLMHLFERCFPQDHAALVLYSIQHDYWVQANVGHTGNQRWRGARVSCITCVLCNVILRNLVSLYGIHRLFIALMYDTA